MFRSVINDEYLEKGYVYPENTSSNGVTNRSSITFY